MKVGPNDMCLLNGDNIGFTRKGEHLSESNTKGTIAPRKLGAIEVLRDLLETKGWRGLYAGVSPSIMRAFLVSASRFSAYEIVSSQLRGEK